VMEINDLKKANKSGAKFDPEKNKWFQQQYLQAQTNESLANEFSEILKSKNISTTLPLETLVGMLKERAVFSADLFELGKFFFEAPTEYDKKASKKAWKEGTTELMTELIEKIKTISDFNTENATTEIKAWITSKEIGFGKVMMPLRLALVGSLSGPDVYEIAAILGKEETITRLQNAITAL